MARRSIGPYEVLRLLKRGADADVFIAYDRRLKRRVALKFINAPDDRAQRELLVAEARALAAINYRGIVQVFDVIEVKSYVVLVMEYVPGTDLAELCRHTLPGLRTALAIVIELCAALAVAHQCRIVHRDLKPANVLLDVEGHVHLTDFGIALGADGRDVPAGTPGRIAPEVLESQEVDDRADLYALGVLIYHLVAGRHPVQPGASEAGGPVPPLEQVAREVPPALSALVMGLLDEDPRSRPGGATAVRRQLVDIHRALPLRKEAPIDALVKAHRRPEDALEASVALPAGAESGARSRLLGVGAWGFWNLARGTARREELAALVLVAAMVAGMVWMERSRILADFPVVLARAEIMGLASTAGQVGPEDIDKLLREAVLLHPRVGVSVDNVDSSALALQVDCNDYVCGITLRREWREQVALDYRTLHAGAPRAVWIASLQKSLDALFTR